jgi:hypothetical protein
MLICALPTNASQVAVDSPEALPLFIAGSVRPALQACALTVTRRVSQRRIFYDAAASELVASAG